jgi:hypothetical protein
MIRPPKELAGTSPLVPWLNQLREFVMATRFLPGAGLRKKQTTQGVIADVTAEQVTQETGDTWRGDWDSAEDYAEGDIVIRNQENDFIDGVAGTYRANKSIKATDNVSPNPFNSDSGWELYSIAIYEEMIIRTWDPYDSSDGEIQLIGAQCNGKIFQLREIPMCKINSDGTKSIVKRMFLCSEEYT